MSSVADPAVHYLLAAPPADGNPVEVAEGVHWLRLTLPLALDHINVWLLDDGDSWTLVDTGIALPVTLTQWEKLLAENFRRKPITRLLVTHFHPDHIGLAGHLAGTLGCEVWMTRATATIAQYLVDGCTPGSAVEIGGFCDLYGFPDRAEYIRIISGETYRKVISRPPGQWHELRDGQLIEAGGTSWRVLVVGGHARGHAVLCRADGKILISGDQILPTITTNVSFSPGIQSEPDPLREFLGSFDRLDNLPADTLVLPSHGGVFRGLHSRIGQLRRHHADELDRIREWCRVPREAGQVALKLFGKCEPGLHEVLAFGETLAHLEYLRHDQELTRSVENGRAVYRLARQAMAGG